MAGFGDLLQRIAHSLEEAGAQRPGDDLRARLGYGTGEDEEEELASETVWEPEAERGSETVRKSESPRRPEAARDAGVPRPRPTAWAAKPPRAPAPATSRTSATHHAPLRDRALEGRQSIAAKPPHAHVSAASRISERLRTRLHTVDALRESFVLKEILDRPLARRRRGQGRPPEG